jgi:hypothetical protein
MPEFSGLHDMSLGVYPFSRFLISNTHLFGRYSGFNLGCSWLLESISRELSLDRDGPLWIGVLLVVFGGILAG